MSRFENSQEAKAHKIFSQRRKARAYSSRIAPTSRLTKLTSHFQRDETNETTDNEPMKHDSIKSLSKSAKDAVRIVSNVMNSRSFRKTVDLASAFAEASDPFIKQRTPWNAGVALFKIAKVLYTQSETWADTNFDHDVYRCPFNSEFCSIIWNQIKNRPYDLIKTSDPETAIRKITFKGGEELFVVWKIKLDYADTMWARHEHVEGIRTATMVMLWQSLGADKHSIVMRRAPLGAAFTNSSSIVFEVDEELVAHNSLSAVKHTSYFKKCIAAGVPRNVMLYGPPGTGKSTLARAIVNNLGLRSFRFRIKDLEHLDNSTISEALSVFKPDAIIIDDLDRMHSPLGLLETLEHFQRHVKLVIVSVNDFSHMDDALLRPERFDELILVDRMDEEVVRKLLGEYSDGYEFVKNWPVVFIKEYVKRRRFMDPNEVESSMKDLVARVARLSRYRTDVENWSNAFEKVVDTSDENKGDCVDVKDDEKLLEKASKLTWSDADEDAIEEEEEEIHYPGSNDC